MLRTKKNFGENETVGEMRKRLDLLSKDAVLVNKFNNIRLAILCDSEKPAYWIRHIFEKSEVVTLKFIDSKKDQEEEKNGINTIKLPHDSKDEMTSIRLLQYLQRRGKRYGYLDVSSCDTVRGQKWCVLSKERLLFFSPTKTLSKNIRYLPLHVTTRCNVVSETSFQIRADASARFCDPITLSTNSRAEAIAWVEAITNRDSVISENRLFESVENEISAQEQDISNEDQRRLLRLGTLEGVLRNRAMRTEFEKFIKRDSSTSTSRARANMLQFWIECERYRTTHPEEKRSRKDENDEKQREEDESKEFSLSSSSSSSPWKNNHQHSRSLPEFVQMRRRNDIDDDGEEEEEETQEEHGKKLLRSESTQIYMQRTRQGPPTWIPDSETDTCMWRGCRLVFRSFRQKMIGSNQSRARHHCRGCGGLFCDSHCSKTLPLPFFGLKNPVRSVFAPPNCTCSPQRNTRTLLHSNIQVRVCDDCWQFFFKPPVTKHRSVSSETTSGAKAMKKRDKVLLSSFRNVSAREMSRAFARRIFRNFLSQDAMFSLPGVDETTREDIRNHLQEAQSHLFRFVQESVFRELRENEFNRFVKLKQFRNLQKCSIWHDNENKSLNTTHHLKMQYRSMGAILNSNTSSSTAKTNTKSLNIRSVRGRSTYVPTPSFATLEEWEKSSAWMNLERVPEDLEEHVDIHDDGGDCSKSTSGSSRKSHSFSSNSMTPRSTGTSLLFRSSVGVLFTPPSRLSSSLDVVHEEKEEKKEHGVVQSKLTKATPSRVSSSSDITEFDATTTCTPPREISKSDVILKGWLSCRLVIPWLSVVSNNGFVREKYEKEAEIGLHFVVLRSDGTLRRFVDETMKMSSGPSIDVKLRVYDVSWTKETGASEQSFEIATKDGIYIFSQTLCGENQITALKWMKSIRRLSSATLLDVKIDNKSTVIFESYLWKKSRGGLFSSDQMRRRRFRLCRDEKHGDDAAPYIKYYDGNDSFKGTIVLDDILDVFCRAPTNMERETGLVVSNETEKFELKYFFDLVVPERRWTFCAETLSDMQRWVLLLRRYKKC